MPEKHLTAPPAAADKNISVSNWLRLVRVYNLMCKELRSRLKEQSGCTLPQFDVLAQLHRFGRGMTFVELSRELLVTSGNLTGIVDRLTAMGHVTRQPDQRDRRVIRVVLTPGGADLMEQLLPRHSADLEDLLHALSAADQQALQRVLGKLRVSLQSVG